MRENKNAASASSEPATRPASIIYLAKLGRGFAKSGCVLFPFLLLFKESLTSVSNQKLLNEYYHCDRLLKEFDRQPFKTNQQIELSGINHLHANYSLTA